MKEGYEKYCRFYMCEEKECWYNGCQCEGERLIIPKETFDKDVERSYSEEDMKQFALKCVITYTFNKNFISDNFRIPIERNNNNQFEQFKKK